MVIISHLALRFAYGLGFTETQLFVSWIVVKNLEGEGGDHRKMIQHLHDALVDLSSFVA